MNRNGRVFRNLIVFLISFIVFSPITGQRINTLRYPHGSLSHRIEQLKADKDVDGLLDELEKNDRVTTHIAILAIGEIGNQEAIDALISLIINPKNWIERLTSSEALAKIAPPEAFEPLMTAFMYECERYIPENTYPRIVRDYGTSDEIIERRLLLAFNTFVSKDKDRFLPILDKQLEDLDIPKKYRYHIATILGIHGNSNALPVLVECLEQCESGIMRVMAAHSLEFLGDKRAIRPLIQALEDDYVPESHGDVKKNYGYVVRLAAYAALKTLGVEVEKEGGRYIVEDE